MAKIRVYELARDLNMTSKVLLGKLKDMDIRVGSHVSSLEDETVAMIKEQLFGSKIEERRIKSTVIRRRKKTVHMEPDGEKIEDETIPETDAEEEPSEPDETAFEDVHSIPEEPSVEDAYPIEDAQVPEKAPEAIEETAVLHQDIATEPTQPEPETETGNVVKKRARAIPEGGESAKIIRKAPITEEPKAEKQIVVEVPDILDEIIEKTPEAPISVSEPPESTSEPESVSEIETVEPEVTVTAEESPITENPEAVPEQPTQEKSDKTPSGKSKTKKKSRKSKKDMPAKIIALPTQAEEKPILTEIDAQPPEEEIVTSETVPETEPSGTKDAEAKDSDRKKKKKKRGVAEEAEGDKKWVKKRISFRRKEVIEGDALYANKRMRKGKKGGKMKPVLSQKPLITTPKAIKRRIKIDDTIVLADLAKRMGIKANEIIRTLLAMGVMVTLNQTLDFETAVLVASEFEYEVERASFEEENLVRIEKDNPEKMEKRPPVVTIMGHVDHGKTSLLDVIRKTRITDGEAGGITQHIGAYHVPLETGAVVFLDTPGHEAFTAMRARGAKVTDIVVLVVAADDGVMPQTIEAINHSKASEVPIIVAVNKIDKANADTDRVYRELSEQGLVPEDWGGDTIFVKVSAKQNQGIDELLEMILLQSELLELKADPDKHAVGYVVESKLDSGRGPVATVLIQEGTLRAGDSVVCGIHHGKIRALLNDLGEQVESAGPSIPVAILGLSGVPNAGDEMITLADDKSAKQVSSHRAQKQRSKDLTRTNRLSLDKLFERIQEGEVKDLNIILKADVHGSIEALGDSLTSLSNDEVSINIVHSATGTISESDVSLAEVSNAIIIGFNVRPSAKIQILANEENVDMRFYNVIYDVIRDVKDAILGLMSSTYEEKILGRAEIRQVFHVPKMGAVAGSYVTDGKIERGCLVRLLRDGVVNFTGKLGSLRRFKDDAKEVMTGYECGIGIENYNDIKVGDVIEAYYLEEIKPEL